MKKILQTLKYLYKSYALLISIGFLSILGSAAITDLIFYLTSGYNKNSPAPQTVKIPEPMDAAAAVFALLIGLILFLVNFRVALANGISRKTFLLANLPAAGITAAVFSVFNLVAVLVHGLFWPVTLTSELFYPQIGWVWLLILQFALYFLLIVVGWFIVLAYYRSSAPVKWAISLAPFVLYGLLKVVDAGSGGVIFQAINEYQHATMRIAVAPFTLLAYSMVLCGLVYLLIRRAPLKN